ncbi:MAG: DUF7010 family protein [Acidobacteriaceae bacterium]
MQHEDIINGILVISYSLTAPQRKNFMQPTEATLPDNYERNARAFGRAFGTIFLSVFGLAWILLALADMGRPHAAIAIPLGCVAASLVVASITTIHRTHGPVRSDREHAARGKRINRFFGLVNALQYASFFLAGILLSHFHRIYLIVPWVIFIIGAHFLPLAHLFQDRLYYLTGPSMMTWALLAPLLFSAHFMEAAAALGAGIILWLTALKLTLDTVRVVRSIRTAAELQSASCTLL